MQVLYACIGNAVFGRVMLAALPMLLRHNLTRQEQETLDDFRFPSECRLSKE